VRVTRCLVVVAVTMVATLALTSTGAPQGQAEQHLQRGVELLEAGHLAEAIDELQHAVALQPGDARAQYQLGRALSTAGRQTAAAEHLRAALENTDEPGAVHFLLGQVLLETGDLEAAHVSLEEAASSRPAYPPIDFYRAELCYRLGRVDTARQRFAVLSAVVPDWTAPLVRSGTLALEQGESSDAVRWFNALVEASPSDPVVWMRFATALVEDGQAYEALSAYRRAAEVMPNYVPALVAVAVQLINLDEYGEAMAALGVVLAEDPDHGLIRYHRAKLIARAGDHLKALTEIEISLEDLRSAPRARTPGPEGDSSFPQAALLRAELLLEVGRDQEAVEAARQIIGNEPDYPEALFLLGNVLLRRGDREGEDLLRRFQVLSDAREQRQLGDQYRLRDGDPERARGAYEEALQKLPDDARSLLGLGAIQRQTGDAQGAVETLAAAHEVGAAGADWHLEWVLALFEAGRSDEARRAWIEAKAQGLTLGPAVWALMREPLGDC